MTIVDKKDLLHALKTSFFHPQCIATFHDIELLLANKLMFIQQFAIQIELQEAGHEY